MNAPLWAALLLGLGGSLHCIGMCGPLVLAFGSQRSAWWSPVAYHAGRLLAYVLIGYGLGMIGWGLSFIVLQQVLSVVSGGLLLALVLVQLKLLPAPSAYRWIETKVKAGYASVGTHAHWRIPILGFLNGLLPCGLVYVAAAAALSAHAWWGGAAWMLVFGLGTLPALLVLGTLPRWPAMQAIARRGNRWMPYLGIALALWMIVRGVGISEAAAQSTPVAPITKAYHCPLCK